MASKPKTSWDDLPHEMHLEITRRIHRRRDLLAWSTATRLPVDEAMTDTVAAILLGALKRPRWRALGRIPMATIERVSRSRNLRPSVALLPHAAAAGRLDALWWICREAVDAPVRTPTGDRPDCKARARSALYGAMDSLVVAGAGDETALDFLLAQAAEWGMPVPRRVLARLAQEAIANKGDDVFWFLHNRLINAGSPSTDARDCGCDFIDALLNSDHLTVFRQLLAAGCRCVPLDAATGMLGRAISYGAARILDWLIDQGSPCIVAGSASYFDAMAGVSRGCPEALMIAHDRGVYVCPSAALCVAARVGYERVLAWASGETRADGRPIQPCIDDCGNALSWAPSSRFGGAAHRAYERVVRWILSQPDVDAGLQATITRNLDSSRYQALLSVLHAEKLLRDGGDDCATADSESPA